MPKQVQGFYVGYKNATGGARSAYDQAQDILSKFNSSPQPVGITYSANYDQTKALKAFYNNPSEANWKQVRQTFANAANQGKVMKEMLKQLDDLPLSQRTQFRILPITTMGGQYSPNVHLPNALQDDMQNINNFAGIGGTVLGWQNENNNDNTKDKYAVGGGVAAGFKGSNANYVQNHLNQLAATPQGQPSPPVQQCKGATKAVQASTQQKSKPSTPPPPRSTTSKPLSEEQKVAKLIGDKLGIDPNKLDVEVKQGQYVVSTQDQSFMDKLAQTGVNYEPNSQFGWSHQQATLPKAEVDALAPNRPATSKPLSEEQKIAKLIGDKLGIDPNKIDVESKQGQYVVSTQDQSFMDKLAQTGVSYEPNSQFGWTHQQATLPKAAIHALASNRPGQASRGRMREQLRNIAKKANPDRPTTSANQQELDDVASKLSDRLGITVTSDQISKEINPISGNESYYITAKSEDLIDKLLGNNITHYGQPGSSNVNIDKEDMDNLAKPDFTPRAGM